MSNQRLDGQLEARHLAITCFLRNIGIAQFRKMPEWEREAIAVDAGLTDPGIAAALRFIGVSRNAPDLIAHANTLEASLLKSVTSA